MNKSKTRVVLLPQNPYKMFAYWTISTDDHQSLVDNFGSNIYDNSVLYLHINNLTTNRSWEIPVNGFSKNWYISVDEPNCRYEVSLCRKLNIDIIQEIKSNDIIIPTKSPIKFENNVIIICSSNVIQCPADKPIRFNMIKFKNTIDNSNANKEANYVFDNYFKYDGTSSSSATSCQH